MRLPIRAGCGELDARYRCCSCGFEFDHTQGGSAGHDVMGLMIVPHGLPEGCSRCGHKYIVWLNYEEMRVRRFR